MESTILSKKVNNTKLRKVIFLDIDGVLQPIRSNERFKHNLDELREEISRKYNDEKYLKIDKYDIGAVYYDWDTKAVENLRKLIIETDSEIVISSSWRVYSPLEKLKYFFKMHNLDQFITDETPTVGIARHEEITTFLEGNKDITHFVILDDIDFSKHFTENFVLTKCYFDNECYEKALRILSV